MEAERLPGGFLLRMSPEVFPLGQDSILLADFARPRPRGRMVDLGAGAGVLSLILLARYPQLSAVALERDHAAAALCRENCLINGLEERMEVISGDVCNARSLLAHDAYDLAVINPPYFDPVAGKAHKRLPAARQQDCPIDAFAAAAAFALKQGGRCAIVYRPERLVSLLAAMQQARLTPKRLRLVHAHAGKAPSAVLVEAVKDAGEGLSILPPLLICTADGEHSNEYKKIYNIL